MSRILLLNPNTSTSVTALLQRHADACLREAEPGATAAVPGLRFEAATARLGAPYIACEASYAVAGHAALDAWAEAALRGPLAAVLIACFGDPGLHALRERSAAPVTGLAEAAFQQAAAHGRFAIVTGGERWKPMLERLAWGLGFGPQLAGIHTVAPSGAELARDPVGAQALLGQACQDAAARFQADAVILGGAGLAGQAAGIRPMLAVPLVDSVEAGLRRALALATKAQAVPPPAWPQPPAIDWKGVAAELVASGVDPRFVARPG